MKKLRFCKGCGAKEQRTNLGGISFTNFALGGYCADCINKALKQTRSDELTIHYNKKKKGGKQ